MKRLLFALLCLVLVTSSGCLLAMKPFSRDVARIKALTLKARKDIAKTPAEMRDDIVKSEEAYVQNALALADKGDIDGALTLFDDEVKVNPSNHRAYYYKGMFLIVFDRTEDSLDVLDKGISIKPGDFELNGTKVLALILLGRSDEAFRNYSNFLMSAKPPEAGAFGGIGYNLAQAGNYEDAGRRFAEAVKLDPTDYTSLNNLGALSNYLGRYEDAVMQFDTALTARPDKESAYAGKGYSLIKLGRVQEGLAEFDLAFARGMQTSDIYLGRGYAYAVSGDYGEALKQLDSGLALSANDRDARLCKAYALTGRNADGDRKAATDILQGLVAEEPRDIVAAYAYSLLGDKEKSSALRAEIIKADTTMELEFRTSPLMSR